MQCGGSAAGTRRCGRCAAGLGIEMATQFRLMRPQKARFTLHFIDDVGGTAFHVSKAACMETHVPHEDNAAPMYRSGTAARMAKMPVSTLRVWEQRYGVISPSKSQSGQRLYSSEDVKRLALLRSLVNQGHAIGAIAHADSTELQQLLDASLAAEAPALAPATAAISLSVCGTLLAERVRRRKSTLVSLGIEPVIELPALDAEAQLESPPSTDALIAEAASLHPETAEALLALARRCCEPAVYRRAARSLGAEVPPNDLPPMRLRTGTYDPLAQRRNQRPAAAAGT